MNERGHIAVRNAIADLARCIRAIDINDKAELEFCREMMALSMSQLLEAFPTVGLEDVA